MRFYQKIKLETIFNVQKCMCHRALFRAYLHKSRGHEIMQFLIPSYEACPNSVGIDHQSLSSRLLNLDTPQNWKPKTLKVWQIREIDF